MDPDPSAGGPSAGTHEPIWTATSPPTDYDALDGRLDVDVAVVGGGIVGITTALRLVEAGRSVAVLERDRIVQATTGHTTAKLTSKHGLIYHHLTEKVGEREAALYGQANEAAIDAVEDTAERYGIDCDFERAPAISYVEDRADREQIRREVEAARAAGLPASFVEETDLPYEIEAGVRFDDQALFHPRAYLLGLAEAVVDGGGHVFEETTVTDVDGGRHPEVETDRGTVTADSVVVASHFPVHDHGLYFARLTPKRSYVLAARLADDPPEAMYYDPSDPYFSVRPRPAGEGDTVLIGGENHRTGEGGSTEERYRRLERRARERFDVESVAYSWSTQDYVSPDKIPFVGKLAPQTRNVYVGTGFGGWGMTNGTAAGLILADLVCGRDNEWTEVFRPTRFTVRASAGKLVEHNAHAVTELVRDYAERRPRLDVENVPPGKAEVFDDRDDPVGVYRDEDGRVHAVDATCTHMGCVVEWNDGERSWDCPCHGSRFDVDGSVLDTPAVDGLDALDVARPPVEADDD